MYFNLSTVMLARCLFYVLAFHTSISSSNENKEDRVKQMNELLNNPGWVELDPLVIVDNDIPYTLNSFLTADTEGQRLVNEKNVDRKIQQSYQFLSCKYAIMFMTYNCYVQSIGRKCREMETDSEKLSCVDRFRDFTNKDYLITYMEGALFYFTRLSPQITMTNDVFDSIKGYKIKRNQTSHPDGAFIENIHGREIQKTIDYLNEHDIRMAMYFDGFCGPMSYLTDMIVGSSTFSWATSVLWGIHKRQTNSVDILNDLCDKLKSIVHEFLISDYNRIGFTFDPATGNTVLNQNPDMEIPITQLDRLLRHRGWRDLEFIDILMDNTNYSLDDLLMIDANGQIVSEENVNLKVQQAYQFMSCHFADILLKLCNDIKAFGKRCSDMERSPEKVDCVERFMLEIRKSDPVIERMQGAVLYFRRLFPHNAFHGDFRNILDYLKNDFDTTYLIEKDSYQTIEIDFDDLEYQIMYTENSMITIELKTNTYFQMSCLKDVAKQSNLEFDSFVQNRFPSLGFTYDPNSDTPVTVNEDNTFLNNDNIL